MNKNQLMLNRLTENQSVPRPQFGDAAIVYDSDGLIKYVDGNDGGVKLVYPPADVFWVFPEAEIRITAGGGVNPTFFISATSSGSVADLRFFGNSITSASFNNHTNLNKILGASRLTKLQNLGTSFAFIVVGCGFSAEGINEFFAELPVTTNTATLDFRSNPGSATCTTSIATDKGYTVVV